MRSVSSCPFQHAKLLFNKKNFLKKKIAANLYAAVWKCLFDKITFVKMYMFKKTGHK